MQAEFDFVVKANMPSLEADVCREIRKFKDLLKTKEQKLGIKEDFPVHHMNLSNPYMSQPMFPGIQNNFYPEEYEIISPTQAKEVKSENSVRYSSTLFDLVNVEFVLGDLERESTDVIVNLNDEYLSCTNQTSQQIIKVGG
jgi:hypothetical protein